MVANEKKTILQYFHSLHECLRHKLSVSARERNFLASVYLLDPTSDKAPVKPYHIFCVSTAIILRSENSDRLF